MVVRKLLLVLIVLFISATAFAAPYMCADTGAVYSSQALCDAVCNNQCSALTPTTQGSTGSCDTNKFEGFVYDPDTQKTYALTKYTGFWTGFDYTGSTSTDHPNLAIIDSSETNSILAGLLSYYKVSDAWIGCYDPSMSTAYNTVDPGRFVWWNGDALNYSNWTPESYCPSWGIGNPNNALLSQDVGVVQIEGEHWCEMYGNINKNGSACGGGKDLLGTWNDIGEHYWFPASQDYKPYFPALVQWNGALSCVDGYNSDNQSASQVGQNLTQQYCNGKTPCYLCANNDTGEIRECMNNGQLCPIGMEKCTVETSDNQFTNVRSGVKEWYSDWLKKDVISLTGTMGVSGGYVSFYHREVYLPKGDYLVYLESDNYGYVYINGHLLLKNINKITAFSGVASTTYVQSVGCIADILVMLTNAGDASPDCNPEGFYFMIKNKATGKIYVNTNSVTGWQGNLNPSVFGYRAVCPEGYTFNPEFNACIAPACPEGFVYDINRNKCVLQNNQCPDGGRFYYNYCFIRPIVSYGTSGNQFADTLSGVKIYQSWIFKGISVTGNQSVLPGYTSFYFHSIRLTDGTYHLTFLADDDGEVFLDGTPICSNNNSATFTLKNTKTVNIFAFAFNNYNGGDSPTGIKLVIADSSGKVILSTDSLTGWQGNLNPSVFGYRAVCTSPYHFATGYNGCVIGASGPPSCPNGGYFDKYKGWCYALPIVKYTLSCSLGNYPCVQNPSDDKYYCSPNPCYNVSKGQGITVDNSTVTQNDKHADGKITKGGCEGTVYIFNGSAWSCRPPGLDTGGSNCCRKSKDWFGLGSCRAEEKKLAKLREAGECHYVGTKCIDKFLGVCLQGERVYCCFHSLLARIVQEQARKTQALPVSGWGDADSPICWGFTPEQFQKIDWKKINLSEYYSYIEQTIIPNAQKKAEEIQQSVGNKIKNELSGE